MALKLTLEHRNHKRRPMTGFMPGQLFSADRRHEIACRPLDVSPIGIGVFSEEDLEEHGNDFVLMMKDQEIELELVWKIENPGERVGYRYGLRVKDPELDLEQLCESYGFL